MNPRQMQKAMRSMGISQSPVGGVQQVIIRCNDKDIVITNASVTCIEMKGQKSFEISGVVTETAPGTDIPAGPVFAEEDLELVMSQTGCDREKAVKTLEECEGQPAEAIIAIMSER